jgi:hypothetical protein
MNPLSYMVYLAAATRCRVFYILLIIGFRTNLLDR